MSSVRKQLQTAADSGSLWNYTLSPGWEDEDVRILRLCIMRYGCGNWKQICRHFPNKTNGQLNLQTQRLFGQQSLAEFFKLHIDPNLIKAKNDKVVGPKVVRKNNCLVNQGNKQTKAEKEAKIRYNKNTYGIPIELYSKIKVPIRYGKIEPPTTLHDITKKLSLVKRTLYGYRKRMEDIQKDEADPSKIRERDIRDKYRNCIESLNNHLIVSEIINSNKFTNFHNLKCVKRVNVSQNMPTFNIIETSKDDSKIESNENENINVTMKDKTINENSSNDITMSDCRINNNDSKEEESLNDNASIITNVTNTSNSTNSTNENEVKTDSSDNINPITNTNKNKTKKPRKSVRKSTKKKSKTKSVRNSRKRKRGNDDEDWVPNSKRRRTNKQ